MRLFSRWQRRIRDWGRAWRYHVTQPIYDLFGHMGWTVRQWWRTCHFNVLQPLLDLFPNLWWHAVQWWRQLTFRLFLQGLPALFVGTGLIVLTCLSMSPALDADVRYFEQGSAAFQAKDYPLALTCFERICNHDDPRPGDVYQLALTNEALGQTDRAAVLMNQLAPPDRQGYGEAHFWQALHLLQATPQTPVMRKAAEAHLLRSLQGGVKDREWAHWLLGELYFAANQLDQAELHLSKAVKARPATRLRLARLYELRGDRERARREAAIAVDHFQARTKMNLNDHFSRLAWADSKAFLEQFEEASAILEEGWAMSKKPEFRVAQGMVYAAWCDHEVRVKGGKELDQFARVQKGLAYDPNNTALLNRLLAFLTVGGKDAESARSALESMLARGEAPGIVHFALGVDAWHAGGRDQAKLHWERALELAPYLTLASNNLAMLLLDSDPAQLPRALQLVNQALEKAPNNPDFRDTRGRIYAKMGRWREALSDLEAALGNSPNDVSLHRILATVYDELGVPSMAEEHRRQADQLASKKGKG